MFLYWKLSLLSIKISRQSLQCSQEQHFLFLRFDLISYLLDRIHSELNPCTSVKSDSMPFSTILPFQRSISLDSTDNHSIDNQSLFSYSSTTSFRQHFEPIHCFFPSFFITWNHFIEIVDKSFSVFMIGGELLNNKSDMTLQKLAKQKNSFLMFPTLLSRWSNNKSIFITWALSYLGIIEQNIDINLSE